MPIDPRAYVRRLLRACEGATAIEYAIVASGVALAIVATVTTLGSRVNALYASVNGLLN